MPKQAAELFGVQAIVPGSDTRPPGLSPAGLGEFVDLLATEWLSGSGARLLELWERLVNPLMVKERRCVLYDPVTGAREPTDLPTDYFGFVFGFDGSHILMGDKIYSVDGKSIGRR